MDLNTFKNWAVNAGQVGNPTADPNNAFSGQCVSLIQQYLNKVYGIAWTPRGDAKDWGTNANVLSYFDRVNTIQPGDIVTYPAVPGNPFGHIAIALGGGQMLEQNGRIAKKVTVSPLRGGQIAILRRKGTGGNNMEVETLRSIAEARRKLLGRVLNAAGVDTGKIEPDNGVDEAIANIDAKNKAITTLQKQFADATKVANDLQARLVASENTTKALTEKVDKLNAKVDELDNSDNLVISRGFFNSLFDKLKSLVGGK